MADKRYEGELSRTLRWAVDQAMVFHTIMTAPDPVEELDRMLYPEKYETEWEDPEEEIARAERELEEWKREQAVNRAQRRSKK